MEFIIANVWQKNIEESVLSLFSTTNDALEGDMSEEQKVNAGKAYAAVLKQINNDTSAVMKIQQDRFTNRSRYTTAFGLDGSNSTEKQGLVSSGISLFGYGDSTYADAFKSAREELDAHIETEDTLIAQLTTRIQNLAAFASKVYTKINGEEVKGRKIITSGNDEVIASMVEQVGADAITDYVLTPDIMACFEVRMGMCARTAAARAALAASVPDNASAASQSGSGAAATAAPQSGSGAASRGRSDSASSSSSSSHIPG